MEKKFERMANLKDFRGQPLMPRSEKKKWKGNSKKKDNSDE
jgi:hypothetical protein